ncbi:hypothetical protein QP097_07550 [Oligella urethralis]|uniref:hypothetical protein n=1 Tax=Oligella urethralis TaxID=90245 RepID=UPI00254D50EF|nr:hypothetical protein [Oligella urethralis]MDK6203313.1 hypothetical protein [Oligella urethralis]
MTYEQLRAIVIAKMMAFNGIAQDRIDYQNPVVRFKAPSDGLWCRLTIETARPVVDGLCEPSTRIPGHIIIQCFEKTHSQVPTLALTKLADKLIEHFQFWETEGLVCREARVINVGNSDEYSQANVLIYFITW